MKVLILGCGPAGLIAAHAAQKLGVNYIVLSKARKSYMNGAQYLHAPIPGVSFKSPFTINYQLSGDVAGYRAKVYGADSQIEVSPESLLGHHKAWDIREAYDNLWKKYGDDVQEVEVTPSILSNVQRSWSPDVIISTIPATVLCYNGQHKFQSQKIWASNERECILPDNTVMCNGDPEFPWYRTSRIQGHSNTEWSHDAYPEQHKGDLWEVVKPISTTCNCFPFVHRMGRYGKWTKGVLSHQAWEEANTILNGALHASTGTTHA